MIFIISFKKNLKNRQDLCGREEHTIAFCHCQKTQRIVGSKGKRVKRKLKKIYDHRVLCPFSRKWSAHLTFAF